MAGAELLAIERTEIHCFFLAHAFIWGGRGVPNGNYKEALKPLTFSLLPLPLPAVDLTNHPWAGDARPSQMLHLWLILRQHKEGSATLEATGCLQEAR